jgi:hypothetical protein
MAYCFLLITNSYAHEGHDEAKKEKSPTGKNYFTVHSVSDMFEMVLRYTPGEAGHKTEMTLFVSDFETNQAIDSAKIEITCPEDAQLKFVIEQTDKGTYKIGGTFPENKSYTLIANISVGDNADLMTIEGIEVGKKLQVAEKEHAETSFFNWQTIGAFSGGIIFSVLLLYIIVRMKKVTVTH